MLKGFAIFDTISRKVIEVLAILLFALITVLGALRSCYLEDGYGQKLFVYKDSLLLNLLFCAVLFLIVKLCADFVAKNMEKRRRILLILTLVYTFILSLGWAAVSKCFPTADQASVYYGAKHFAANYFAEISEKNSYFSCYPHQMGLALFYELILRLFHTESFHLLQGVNAVCNCITVFSLYKITTLLFQEKKVSVYFLLLMLLCFPLYWYTPFVYGELPSFAFSFFGVWMLLQAISGAKRAGCEQEKKSQNRSRMALGEVLLLALSLSSLFLATMVRKNTLILVIAVTLTLLVFLLKEKKPWYLLYLLLLVVLCSQANPFAIKLYENRSGGQLNAGVPGISHMVMGLQESEYAPGWYNGFNFTTYAYDADYDQAEAIRLSKLALQERLDEFRADPAYTFRFFRDKFMAEWLNTGYACYDSTAGKYYDRLPIVESLYSGTGFYATRFFMDKYQFGIYLFALIFVVGKLGIRRKSQKNQDKIQGDLVTDPVAKPVEGVALILQYTLLVTVIGGALFYLVWEGSGRYILPYFLMAIPYAAAGLAGLERLIGEGRQALSTTFKKKQSIV